MPEGIKYSNAITSKLKKGACQELCVVTPTIACSQWASLFGGAPGMACSSNANREVRCIVK